METNVKNDSKGKFIMIRDKDGYLKVYVDEIVYCKADGSYSDIILDNGIKIPVTSTLKALEAKINESSILRCHHSYLVNGKKVIQIVRCKRKLITPIETIPVSRRKWHGAVLTIKSLNTGS